MRKLLLGCLAALVAFGGAFAQVSVKGYTRKDGTYVAPYQRTAPNSTRDDNYSTRGNINPYTGEPGTKPRDAEAAIPRYTAPAPVRPESSSLPATKPTALCRDGSKSYSQNRSGTCSSHGGVDTWY